LDFRFENIPSGNPDRLRWEKKLNKNDKKVAEKEIPDHLQF
jgi:hypothetical protein